MSYRIERAIHIDDLQRAVNAALAEGWRPLGGVAVAQMNSVAMFCQALVLEEKR